MCVFQDKCRIIHSNCVDKEAPVDCSEFYYGDDECTPQNGCYADCDNRVRGRASPTFWPEPAPHPMPDPTLAAWP
jgi:hypothetical protein